MLFIAISILFIFISLFRFLKTKKLNASLAFLLMAFCFIIISVKMNYVYHNRFFSFGVLSIIVYFLISKELTVVLRILLFSVAIITFIVVMIPDKFILAYSYNSILTNGERITWYDFKAEPNNERGNMSRINTNILWKLNKVYDYPPAIVLSYVDPNKSWVKNRSTEPSYDLLLHHEQVHFYISEYCARLANDSLKTAWSNKTKVLSIINTFKLRLSDMQKKYDSLTEHGIRVDKQFEFTKDIKEKLGIPSLSTDSENIPYTLD